MDRRIKESAKERSDKQIGGANHSSIQREESRVANSFSKGPL